MTEKTVSASTEEKAHRLAERFDAHALGLIFGILALSVQTADFGESVVADLLELSSWVLFLFSGVVGLWRAEWSAHVQQSLSAVQRIQEIAHEVRVAIGSGTTTAVNYRTGTQQPAKDYLAELERDEERLNRAFVPIASRQNSKYRAMRWSFLLALLVLVLGRAWVPFQDVLWHF